jgi:hypothetical protein
MLDKRLNNTENRRLPGASSDYLASITAATRRA